MKKKIIIFLLFFVALVSCGKKADPEYKESKASKIILNTI